MVCVLRTRNTRSLVACVDPNPPSHTPEKLRTVPQARVPEGSSSSTELPPRHPLPDGGVSGQTSPPPWNPATLCETLCERGGLFVHAPSGTIGTRLFFYPGGIRGSPTPFGGERVLRGGIPLSFKNKKKRDPCPRPTCGEGLDRGLDSGFLLPTSGASATTRRMTADPVGGRQPPANTPSRTRRRIGISRKFALVIKNRPHSPRYLKKISLSPAQKKRLEKMGQGGHVEPSS